MAAALVVAGCGGSSASSSGVSASSYVKSICTAVGSFRTDVQNKISSLGAAHISTPAEGKKALQDFLSAASTSADTAVTKLQTAGSPNVNNGKQISASLTTAFNQLSSALKQAETSTNSLSTSSKTAFAAGAKTIQTNIQNSIQGMLSSLGALKSQALASAAKKEPACTSLSTTG
ncbi:MAG TPA: hypothetical protein VGF81_11055 [Solirubrobacteraceae bacterium]